MDAPQPGTVRVRGVPRQQHRLDGPPLGRLGTAESPGGLQGHQSVRRAGRPVQVHRPGRRRSLRPEVARRHPLVPPGQGAGDSQGGHGPRLPEPGFLGQPEGPVRLLSSEWTHPSHWAAGPRRQDRRLPRFSELVRTGLSGVSGSAGGASVHQPDPSLRPRSPHLSGVPQAVRSRKKSGSEDNGSFGRGLHEQPGRRSLSPLG